MMRNAPENMDNDSRHGQARNVEASMAMAGSASQVPPQVDSPRPRIEDDDDEASDIDILEDLDRNFELKNIIKDPDAPEDRASTSHDEYPEEDDSDEEKATQSLRDRRLSGGTDHSFMLYTPDEERTVLRKFDRRLVLFMALLYMLSFLDRSSMATT